jgi:hypothetical protein
MNFKGGDFSTGEMGNFHPALTIMSTEFIHRSAATCKKR